MKKNIKIIMIFMFVVLPFKVNAFDGGTIVLCDANHQEMSIFSVDDTIYTNFIVFNIQEGHELRVVIFNDKGEEVRSVSSGNYLEPAPPPALPWEESNYEPWFKNFPPGHYTAVGYIRLDKAEERHRHYNYTRKRPASRKYSLAK